MYAMSVSESNNAMFVKDDRRLVFPITFQSIMLSLAD
jgi:hypothetical protein